MKHRLDLVIVLVVIGGLIGGFILRNATKSSPNIAKVKRYCVKYLEMGYSETQITGQLRKFFSPKEIQKGLKAAKKTLQKRS